MTSKTPYFSLAFTLELLLLSFAPTFAVAQQYRPNPNGEIVGEVYQIAEYIPPDDLGKPPTRGGATRPGSLSCPQDETVSANPPLTPLIPSDNSDPNNYWAVTVSDYPEFFIYMPQTSAREAEFVIKDEQENDVYRTKIEISGEAGILKISLPKTEQPLPIDKNYHWYFAIICNPENRGNDLTVDAWTHRREIKASIAQQLERETSAIARSLIYAKNGIWHEALSTLAASLSTSPNDQTLLTEWKKLLTEEGLAQISEFPIFLSASKDL